MKRVLHHPPEATTGRRYWRSLGQLENSPDFQQWIEKEFPQGAAEFQGGEVSRRNFLQLMGASTALAGLALAGCRRPRNLVPFSKGVEWSIPGKPLFFATSMPTKRGAQPLVVATHDGRPTKIEGNPFHPAAKGATNTWAQSSILDLYDPDRSKAFRHADEESDAASFDKALDEMLAKAGDGASLAFLVERTLSPTRERLRAEITAKYPAALWVSYEPTGGVAGDAASTAFGPGVLPVPQLDKADVILAVDADFLSCSEGDVEISRQFSQRRNVSGPETRMNRLYVVENRYTVTGAMADHRLRVPASQAGAFLAALGAALNKTANDPALAGALQSVKASNGSFNAEWVREAAADLAANKGRCVVLVGERQPAGVQALGHAINVALGSIGATILGRPAVEKPSKSIEELAAALASKTVQTLFILGGNPVYNAPADLAWLEKQALAASVIRLGLHEDETSKAEDGKARVTWHVPMAHYLESWGDGVATDGSYTAIQPMIMPLYDGWSDLDLLARIAGRPKPHGPELVQETFRERLGGNANFIPAWAGFLRQGFLADSAPKPAALNFNSASAGQPAAAQAMPAPLADGEFEIVFAADSKVDDGRYANNGWLQELPDPISKLTWDNAALISPKDAREKFGIEEFDRDMKVGMIKVTVGDASLELPALISPGAADGSITIPLGYGRTVVGRVGRGTGNLGTGFNAYPLRTSRNPYFVTGAKVERVAGKTFQVGVTQEHGTLEGRGADLTREATFEQYKIVSGAAEGSEERDFFKKAGMDSHIPKNVSLYGHPPLSDANDWSVAKDVHAWGMTVDLNTCVGCSACMIACQAENNIPIVGKEQVIGNREMHWIRVDRYYASENGNMDDPEIVSQPMLCQHCENAPCETVCPVNATVHSEDGLNVMAYNRCIGTRYCANNCPFKVRRFNFFDYNQRDVLGHKTGNPFSGLYKWNLISEKGTPDTLKMQKNPNVTVRMRGVMEKCTFCIQRVQEAKITAKVHARDSDAVPRVPANAFTTACAQVCPTNAITFGDINNPDSDVSKIRQSERGYRLLEYLNVSPRVWYLARVRNPNPKMPDAAKLGSFMHEPREAGAATALNGGNA